MKKILWLVAIGSYVFGVVACAAAPDNEAACKSFAAKLTKVYTDCGVDKAATDIVVKAYDNACPNFKNTTCDVSAYWACLEPKYTCDSANKAVKVDPTVTECAAKSTCK